jgi:hypothetical protein
MVGTFRLGNDREAPAANLSHSSTHQNQRHAASTSRRSAPPGNGASGKSISSPKGRKQVAHAPVLVGSSAARSDDGSFEEF